MWIRIAVGVVALALLIALGMLVLSSRTAVAGTGRDGGSLQCRLGR